MAPSTDTPASPRRSSLLAKPDLALSRHGPAAGTVAVTRARVGQLWAVPLDQIDVVGVRCSTLI